MDQKTFAEKKMKCSESLWSLVLNGKRSFGFLKAKKAAQLLGTSVDLWIDPSTPQVKRRKAWDKFISNHNRQGGRK